MPADQCPSNVGTFLKHQIDRLVPVEQLVKCRMQDNLEFLQWSKRFWDQHYAGGEYDAFARRRASGAPPTSSGGGAGTITGNTPSSRTSSGTATRRGTTPTATGGRAAKPGLGGASAMALQHENAALKENVTGLERERDFYFLKLRDIELLLQRAVEANPELEKEDDGLTKQIQNILYSTEVCFILFLILLFPFPFHHSDLEPPTPPSFFLPMSLRTA